MIFSFGKTSLPPTIKPKDDFSYYQQLEKNLVNRFNLTNEQFESLFFENGKIGETKQGPFTLCHWDSMIDTIKETPYFSTLIRLNIKENKPGAERQTS